MTKQAMWVPGYVAVAEHVGGGGLGSIDGPFRTYDGGPLGFVPQHDYQDMVGLRQGFGVRFRGKANQQVWFHFAITTPVINNGDRVSLERVFVLWKTTGGARLLLVHVRDGALELLQPFSVNLAGTFDGSPNQPGTDPISKSQLEGQNRFTLSPAPTVFFGIGISALIGFDPHSDDSEVSFASAGADFSTP